MSDSIKYKITTAALMAAMLCAWGISRKSQRLYGWFAMLPYGVESVLFMCDLCKQGVTLGDAMAGRLEGFAIHHGLDIEDVLEPLIAREA